MADQTPGGAAPPLLLRQYLTALRGCWRRRILLSGAGLASAGVGGSLLLLGFLSLVPGIPPDARPFLRWLPLAAGCVFLLAALVRALRPPPAGELALRAEARVPELEHLPRTLLTLPADHPLRPLLEARFRRVLPSAPTARVFPALPRGRLLGFFLLLAAGSAVTLAHGGPLAAWSAWSGQAAIPGIPTAGTSQESNGVMEGEAGSLLDEVTYRLTPPAYTGLPVEEGRVEGGIEALAGSRLELRGMEGAAGSGPGRSPGVRVVRAGGEGHAPQVTEERGGVWSSAWSISPDDRGVELVSAWREDEESTEGGQDRRLIPLTVLLDGPPEVELVEPARDLVLASGTGEIRFRARARDPFGVEAFHMDWVHTRGSGESFDFREGEWRWASVQEEGGVWEGELRVDLAEVGLGPGDVLHVRALARDGNSATGPGVGVSATRQFRVVREGEEMEVDALVGFPLDVDQDPILTQRMVLLLTQDLLERSPELSRDEFQREASRIAGEQTRVKMQLGEQVFSRATGGMEPILLGQGAAARAESGGGAGAPGGAAQVPTPVPPGPPVSRYGVASLFDPSASSRAAGGGDTEGHDPSHDHDHDADHDHHAHQDHDPDTDPGAGHDHRPGDGHDHAHEEGIPLDMGAGTGIGAHSVGGLGEMPLGFGYLEELGHDHDGDPILSVSRPLLEIYNEMWESERFLLLGDPAASVPHQEFAVARLQELRENRRVFPRGLVRAPPVDVDGVRGTGDVEGVQPEVRSRWEGGEGDGVRRTSEAQVNALLQSLGEMSDAVLAARLHSLALGLLADGGLTQDLAALGVQAADRAREGDREGTRARLLELRAGLDPSPSRGRGMEPPGPATAFQAAWTLGGGDRMARSRGEADGDAAGGDGVALAPGPSGAPTGAALAEALHQPFVFATLRYRSGNWDSAPLVPQNLIHSLAQYTDVAVAPEGVVVDLASEEIFRYPVLYLTGHLPVRFSDAEARNLRHYVERGGFVFMDDHNHDIDGAFHRTATAELARIFGDEALGPLPNDHELYRTFFDFPDGPPTTSHELSGWGDGLIHPELHAVLVDGRIGVLYSNKDYSSEWSYHAVNKRFLAVDNTRFGVNILLYALTR
jgi:hypothetical protein